MTPPNQFDEFWAAYPNRVAKLAAKRAWLKMAAEMPPHDALMRAVERYKANKPPHQDWCHPATWLNAGRWDDEFAPPTIPKASASVEVIRDTKALERIEERIKYLRGQFPLDETLKSQWNDLKTERSKLLTALNFKV